MDPPPTAERIGHLEATQHRSLKQEQAHLNELDAKVSLMQGKQHHGLIQAAELQAELCADLEAHLQKEEQLPFLMIRRLVTASHRPSFDWGSNANPIAVMRHAAAATTRQAIAPPRRGRSWRLSPTCTCTSRSTICFRRGWRCRKGCPSAHLNACVPYQSLERWALPTGAKERFQQKSFFQ